METQRIEELINSSKEGLNEIKYFNELHKLELKLGYCSKRKVERHRLLMLADEMRTPSQSPTHAS